jgi:hypothetical protein
VGNLTDNVVYDRLAPGVNQRLKELIGRDESGRLKKKMFQRLTDEVGDPKLREHLASVEALMKAADDWPGFIKMIDRALPKYKPMPLFDPPEPQARRAGGPHSRGRHQSSTQCQNTTRGCCLRSPTPYRPQVWAA